MPSEHEVMYGISRIDSAKERAHAWRVSLRRNGKRLVKNFTDRHYGGKKKALLAAQHYRDDLLRQHPPMSRKTFAKILRSNNLTGVSGVYRYAKRYRLKDGTQKESWYWEANWPTSPGVSAKATFSVNRYGEDIARLMALQAREKGLAAVEGVFWASARGEMPSAGRAGHDDDRRVA
ncbi:MAG: AP2 domain-containing protein [Pseudomonadota bacterium]